MEKSNEISRCESVCYDCALAAISKINALPLAEKEYGNYAIECIEEIKQAIVDKCALAAAQHALETMLYLDDLRAFKTLGELVPIQDLENAIKNLMQAHEV